MSPVHYCDKMDYTTNHHQCQTINHQRVYVFISLQYAICTLNVLLAYLVIPGCLQLVVDQLKVQTIFLLQSSMKLCFLRKGEIKKKT